LARLWSPAETSFVQTLNRHLAGSFLLSLVTTLLVVTFVMCIGIVFKVTDLIARGMDWRPVVRILLHGFPQALTYSIPISLLTASLLVFGRLSADGEVTAMKASGISLWRVVSTPCLVAVACTVVCLYINNELVPNGHYVRRQIISRLGVESPVELLEEGRFMQEFPGMTIYIEKKKGNRLTNVRIYDLRKRGVRREIRAGSGEVGEVNELRELRLDLFDVRIDPWADDREGAAYADQWTVMVPLTKRRRPYRRKRDDMSFTELAWNIRNIDQEYPQLDEEDLVRQKTKLTVELNKRLVLSVSCFAFVMLGIPLGIKAHRKESSIGIGISLLLVFHFYLFILVAETLEKRPQYQPHLINWIPVVLSLALGAWLVHRNN